MLPCGTATVEQEAESFEGFQVLCRLSLSRLLDIADDVVSTACVVDERLGCERVPGRSFLLSPLKNPVELFDASPREDMVSKRALD